MHLGRIGIWRPSRFVRPELAAELEKLGFGAIWLGGSPPGDLAIAETLLDATDRIVIATSIVNIWKDDAAQVAAAYHRLEDRHPGRFMLGIGVGHPEAVPEYRSPYRAIEAYLDALDANTVPAHRRALAALRPRALTLARDRTAGAIPYLTTPEHTRRARASLGPGVLLAPEHKVVLRTDPDEARAIARLTVPKPYLQRVNYLRNLRELGYTDADIAVPGSDRLIDDLALHGTPEQVAAGVRAHLVAGADHVAVQLLTEPDADPVPEYQELAAALL